MARIACPISHSDPHGRSLEFVSLAEGHTTWCALFHHQRYCQSDTAVSHVAIPPHVDQHAFLRRRDTGVGPELVAGLAISFPFRSQCLAHAALPLLGREMQRSVSLQRRYLVRHHLPWMHCSLSGQVLANSTDCGHDLRLDRLRLWRPVHLYNSLADNSTVQLVLHSCIALHRRRTLVACISTGK